MDTWHLTLGNSVSACAYLTYGVVIWATDTGGSRVRLLLRYSGVTLGPLDGVVTVHSANAPPVTDHELIYEYARSYGFTVSPLALLQAACFVGAAGSVYRVLAEIRLSRANASTPCLAVGGATRSLYVFEWVENAVVNACLCAAIYVLFGGLEQVTFVGVLATAIFAELSGLLCEYLVVCGAPSQRQSNAAVGLSFYAAVKFGVAALMFGGILRLRSYQPLLYFVVLGTYVLYNCVYWVFSFQRTLGGLRNIEETEATYVAVGRAAILFAFRTTQVWQLWAIVTSALERAQMRPAGNAGASQPQGVAFLMTVLPISLCFIYLFATWPSPSLLKKTDTLERQGWANDTLHHVVVPMSNQQGRGGPWQASGTWGVLDQQRVLSQEPPKSKKQKAAANTYKISFV